MIRRVPLATNVAPATALCCAFASPKEGEHNGA
jgi:hypothetical protein